MQVARKANVLGKQGLNLPKIRRLIQILDKNVPMDAPSTIEEIISEKNVRGVRVAAWTGGLPWSVELYGGNFYVIKVAGFEPSTATIPLFVVNTLNARLRPKEN